MSFSDDINKFVVNVHNKSDAVVRRTVVGIMESIDYMSPVGNPTLWQSPPPPGYVGGHFRSNWQLNIGSPPTGEIEGTAWQGALDREKAKVPEKAAGKVFYYGNTLPYAQAIEDGTASPQQAPHGLVGITALRFGGIVSKSVAEVNR